MDNGRTQPAFSRWTGASKLADVVVDRLMIREVFRLRGPRGPERTAKTEELALRTPRHLSEVYGVRLRLRPPIFAVADWSRPPCTARSSACSILANKRDGPEAAQTLFAPTCTRSSRRFFQEPQGANSMMLVSSCEST